MDQGQSLPDPAVLPGVAMGSGPQRHCARPGLAGHRRQAMKEQSATATLLRGKTAPQLLAERARAEPDEVAFRSKHLGLYRERTWQDYAGLVARCARGLSGLGLLPGERVAIMGDACEEWMICD